MATRHHLTTTYRFSAMKKGQNQMIEDWLLEGNTITSLEAWKMFGVSRLASIVHRLRRTYGAALVTDMIEVQPENTTIARYKLSI